MTHASRFVTFLSALSWACAARVGAPGAAPAGGAGGGAPDVARGGVIFARYCATCHGVRGDGDGPTMRFYPSPRARDFTRGVYRFRSTASGQLPLRSDLARTIERGVPGTVMPAWGAVMAPGDVASVASFLEGLSPRFAREPEAARAVVPLPPAPAATADSTRRGRLVYLAAGCWNCHGPGGAGDGPAARTLKDDAGRAIRATDFTRGVFKTGGEPVDLFRALVTGLDGTPMPSYLEAIAMTREAGEDLRALDGYAKPVELAALKSFLGGQLTADAYYALEPEARARLSDGWRWDLVYYVLSLAEGRSAWRSFWGL